MAKFLKFDREAVVILLAKFLEVQKYQEGGSFTTTVVYVDQGTYKVNDGNKRDPRLREVTAPCLRIRVKIGIKKHAHRKIYHPSLILVDSRPEYGTFLEEGIKTPFLGFLKEVQEKTGSQFDLKEISPEMMPEGGVREGNLARKSSLTRTAHRVGPVTAEFWTAEYQRNLERQAEYRASKRKGNSPE